MMIRLAGTALMLALLPVLAAAQEAGAGLAPLVDGFGTLAGGVGNNAVLLVVAMTALSLAPGIAITVTCFPFIVTVFSILRSSLGLQQSPPAMLIVALSIFLTWFIMDPVLREIWANAGQPLRDGTITLGEAFDRAVPPLHAFMAARVSPDTLAALAEVAPGPDLPPDRLSVLIPSFMLSELQRAFQIGFLIALPFLIIDLVVAAVLMSMGMMMVPPVVVSLPFKLGFFVIVDGWGMIASALIRSYQ